MKCLSNTLLSAVIQVRPLATKLFIGTIDGGCLRASAGTFAAFPGCQKVHYTALSSKPDGDYCCRINLDFCMSLAVSELSQLSSLQLDVTMKHER